MLVVTGPNMGGKSTYMRQAALIVLLAHAGSFVPAARCVLGPIDRILTRIGAGDDLARGQSTFMVEMAETSYILHHATPQSLVLMDEIGRGTSTYDGLALADAVARHLAHTNRCYTLFATHYFELTALADASHAGGGSGIANVHLDAVEHGERLVFMHAVKDGPANRSLGLQGPRWSACQRRRCSRHAAGWPNWSNAAATATLPRWHPPRWMHRSNSACSPRRLRPRRKPCRRWIRTN